MLRPDAGDLLAITDDDQPIVEHGRGRAVAADPRMSPQQLAARCDADDRVLCGGDDLACAVDVDGDWRGVVAAAAGGPRDLSGDGVERRQRTVVARMNDDDIAFDER